MKLQKLGFGGACCTAGIEDTGLRVWTTSGDGSIHRVEERFWHLPLTLRTPILTMLFLFSPAYHGTYLFIPTSKNPPVRKEGRRGPRADSPRGKQQMVKAFVVPLQFSKSVS